MFVLFYFGEWPKENYLKKYYIIIILLYIGQMYKNKIFSMNMMIYDENKLIHVL
jgi:hypothetical protein